MSNWAIQTNLVDQQRAIDVALAVQESGGCPYEVSVIPFCDDLMFPVEPPNKDLIAYGSTKLITSGIAAGMSGIFFNENFSTSVWNKHRQDMLNQHCNEFPLSGAPEALAFLPEDTQLFVRSCADLKAFAGMVTTVTSLVNHRESNIFGSNAVPPDTWISVAFPQEITAEYRCFVVGGRVIDAAIYRERGRRVNRRVPISLFQELAEDWLPHQTCVMDVALLVNKLKVVEFNCFNASGFYGHNIKVIVEAVSTWFDEVEAL